MARGRKTEGETQTEATGEGLDSNALETQDAQPDLEARMAELAQRERDLMEREEEFARYRDEVQAQAAPRERGNESRSRVLDESVRMERSSMDYYAPANQLEVPKDDDYHYRWVAEYVNGTHMPRMVQTRLREGYSRVNRDELPEDFLVDEDTFGDGWARQSGLILMRWPKEKQAARERFYRNRSMDRANAVDELQGVAGRDAVREDRGTRSLTGAEAGAALASMRQQR